MMCRLGDGLWVLHEWGIIWMNEASSAWMRHNLHEWGINCMSEASFAWVKHHLHEWGINCMSEKSIAWARNQLHEWGINCMSDASVAWVWNQMDEWGINCIREASIACHHEPDLQRISWSGPVVVAGSGWDAWGVSGGVHPYPGMGSQQPFGCGTRSWGASIPHQLARPRPPVARFSSHVLSSTSFIDSRPSGKV